MLELVGAVPTEADGTVVVHGQSHPAAPAQATFVPGHRFHLDRAFHGGDPRQLLGHPEGLEPSLRRELDVLEVAAATPARPGMWARRRDAVG